MFDSCFPWFLLSVKYESDPSFHIKTYVYRVTTPVGRYIVHLEQYIKETYVLKYFPARFKNCGNKFTMISNDNMMQGVVATSLYIFLDWFMVRRKASLGFVATASVFGQLREPKMNNQRFRIYKRVMQNFFGDESFLHFVDIGNSAYLMVNKANQVHENLDEMRRGFGEMYPAMFNLAFTELKN